jgi:hypothetical protein
MHVHTLLRLETAGPDGLWAPAGTSLQWHSDDSVESLGFVVCGAPEVASPAPTPASMSATTFEVVESVPPGACYTSQSGACFTDGVGMYGNNERCTFRVLRPATLVTPNGFSTETFFDVLVVGSNAYSGSTGPAGLTVSPDTVITWSSDDSVTSGGFYVCAGPPTMAPTPPPPDAIFSVLESFPPGACYTNADGTCVTGTVLQAAPVFFKTYCPMPRTTLSHDS